MPKREVIKKHKQKYLTKIAKIIDAISKTGSLIARSIFFVPVIPTYHN